MNLKNGESITVIKNHPRESPPIFRGANKELRHTKDLVGAIEVLAAILDEPARSYYADRKVGETLVRYSF